MRGRTKQLINIPSLEGIPQKPKSLDKIASGEWDRVIQLLKATGNLAVVDGPTLEIYCHNYSTAEQCREHIRKYGLMVETPNHYEVQSPYVNILAKAEKTMITILNQFGMTPKSRKQVKPQELDHPLSEDDDLEDWSEFEDN